MRRITLLACVTALLSACGEAPTSAPAPRLLPTEGPNLAALTETTNESIPFALVQFVPCAAGGAGELIELTGNLHILSHVTISNSGNIVFKAHFQPQGLSGVGLTTGAKYQGTGVTQDILHLKTPFPVVETFINNFRMIGQGPGNNLLVHETFHVTINANGVVTTVVDNVKIDCK